MRAEKLAYLEKKYESKLTPKRIRRKAELRQESRQGRRCPVMEDGEGEAACREASPGM